MPQPAAAAKPARPHRERFIINVLWSWTGVVASLFQGFIITPFIIRRLGYSNRYSLTLFMVPAVFLLVYGYPLLLRWVGPVMANQRGPRLIPRRA
jgi:hypothetical protein